MARVKVLTRLGWIEIPGKFHNIEVIEFTNFGTQLIRGFVQFEVLNEYIMQYGERAKMELISMEDE